MGIYNIRRPSFTPNQFLGGSSNALSPSRFLVSLPMGQDHNLNNFVLQTPLQNGLVSYPLTNSFDNGHNSSFGFSQSGLVWSCNEMHSCNFNHLIPYYNQQPTNQNVCFSLKDCHNNGLRVNPTSFKRSIDKASKVNHWTAEEDRRLAKLVNELGEDKWAMIAQNMGNRVGKQCRERWRNHLKENFKKNEAWTMEEEAIVIEMHMKGERWASISKELRGRPENAIKNHFNATKRKLHGAKPHTAITPFERYIAAFVKSTKNGPNDNENDVVESHDQVMLWLNFDNRIREEMAFANTNFF